MRHLFASLVIASAVATMMAPQAWARDLWGDAGIILSGEKTAVLSRVTRLSPDTRLEPVVVADARIVDQVIEEQAPPPIAPLPQTRALTAPPVPNWEAPATEIAETVIDPGADDLAVSDEPAQDAPDVSGVATIDTGLEFDPKTAGLDAFEMASLGFATTLPPESPEPDVPLEPIPNYDSGAFVGIYGGVGHARGMRLEIELSGNALGGWFVDSSGQVFSLQGELTGEDGQAQAAVISAETVVGFLDLHLTNLGMAALFVPLDEDLTPMVSAARDYEFLRALSSEAQSALDASRSAREANVESDNDGVHPPLRRSPPWDEDRFH